MLRLVSALSIVTWLAIVIGATIAFWPIVGGPPGVQYAVVVLLAACSITLASVMLIRNRPFCIAFSFLLSVAGGLLLGLVGVGALIYCVLSLLAPESFIRPTSVDWFLGINNTIMAVLPVCWAFIWRDYRNNMADRSI